jgi:DNA-binding NtrC family response regulator
VPLCLIVEDDDGQAASIAAALSAGGYNVARSSNAQHALLSAAGLQPDVALLDLGLPDADGLDLIPEILAASPSTRVVVLTGTNCVGTAVTALRSGARHYLVKPWDLDELMVVVDRESRAVDREQTGRRSDGETIYWGQHPEMVRVHKQIGRLARSPWTSVLIHGETGTGKEVVARELHRLTSPPGAFVALNCAAVPSELLESELFGHERGAFTGADTRRKGLAELARDGTLFLDEIGEMPTDLQSKLLRLLQDGSFRRVGGHEEIASRCRFVAATHRNLSDLQSDGRFREDLYFRLAVVRLEIPPLRLRTADLLPLADRLLRQVARSIGMPQRQLAPDAEQAILDHPWRGNVRELRNRIERALVLSEEETLRGIDLDLPERTENDARAGVSEAVRIRSVLDEVGWNVSEAARRLGVERHWLRYRMKRYGLGGVGAPAGGGP